MSDPAACPDGSTQCDLPSQVQCAAVLCRPVQPTIHHTVKFIGQNNTLWEVNILNLFFRITDDTTPDHSKCGNDKGEGPRNKKCIFPFEQSATGVTYDTCAPPDSDDYEWCALVVDDNGVFQSGSGDWGACGPCECETGNACDIPPGKH